MIPADTGASSILCIDLNNDGKQDIVAAQIADSISVLLGDGVDNFSPPVSFVAGSDNFSIASADFNSDSFLDIVTANFDSTNITVLFGNGSEVFHHLPFLMLE